MMVHCILEKAMQNNKHTIADNEYHLLEEITEGENISFDYLNPVPLLSQKFKYPLHKKDYIISNIIHETDNISTQPAICSLNLDKNFVIQNTNEAVQKLFENYFKISNTSFFSVFCKFSEDKKVEAITKNLKSKDLGYSWTGILSYKTRYTKTIYIKTNIFPTFSQTDVNGYFVIFENVTDHYFAQYKDMLGSFIKASRLKDNDMGLHNERLNYYSKALAEEMFKLDEFIQIDVDFIDNIYSLAAIHDIGKIGTPDYILQKKGPLTVSEWKIMREHTINGSLILGGYPISMAKEIALSHHEKWDGSGYPYNLVGEMIPLAARIVAIADVYDALRMKRSYKDEISHDETVQLILKDSGSHFDPSIINVFLKIQSRFNDIWEENKDTPTINN